MFRPDICTAPPDRLLLAPRFKHDAECGICLGSMQGTLVRRLPCDHCFHESCHAKLREAPGHYRYKCPACRADYTGQIQRMKMYDIWDEEVGTQMRRYVRSAHSGGPPWDSEEDRDRVSEFHGWLWSGASEEEVAYLEAALDGESGSDYGSDVEAISLIDGGSSAPEDTPFEGDFPPGW